MNPKEGLVRIAGAGILLGSFMTPIACGSSKPKERTPQFSSPTAAGELKHGQNEQEWNSLSALMRINRLEQNNYPINPDFDPQQELLKATSEFFCEQIPCVVNPLDLQKKVHLLKNDEYLQKIEENLGKAIREQEKVSPTALFVLDPLIRQNKKILINTPPVGQDVKSLKSSLFDSYLRINRSDEETKTKFTISGTSGKKITIDYISNFIFFGTDSDGGIRTFNGGERAMAASILSTLNELIPNVGSENKNYNDAAILLKQLMGIAGISNQELVDYYMGRRPAIEFLQRLGSINRSGNNNLDYGRSIFVIVGLRADGSIPDSNVARKAIEDIIERPLNGGII